MPAGRAGAARRAGCGPELAGSLERARSREGRQPPGRRDGVVAPADPQAGRDAGRQATRHRGRASPAEAGRGRGSPPVRPAARRQAAPRAAPCAPPEAPGERVRVPARERARAVCAVESPQVAWRGGAGRPRQRAGERPGPARRGVPAGGAVRHAGRHWLWLALRRRRAGDDSHRHRHRRQRGGGQTAERTRAQRSAARRARAEEPDQRALEAGERRQRQHEPQAAPVGAHRLTKAAAVRALAQMAPQHRPPQGGPARRRELPADVRARRIARGPAGGQRLPRLEHQCLHLRRRASEAARDLGVRQVAEQREHEGRALILGQAGDIGQDSTQVLARRHVADEPVDPERRAFLQGPAAPRPQDGEAAMPRHRVEPRAEIDLRVTPDQRAIGSQERVLRHVLSLVRRAQDAPAEPKHRRGGSGRRAPRTPRRTRRARARRAAGRRRGGAARR